MENYSEKIYGRLYLIASSIKNSTFGVNDGSYSISHITGVSGINEPYKYEVDFVSDIKLAIEDIVDTDVKFKLKDENAHSRKERFVYGKVFKIEEVSVVAKKFIYRIQLVSPFHYLYFNRRYKIYQNMTAVDIISKIITMSNHLLNLKIVSKLDNITYPQREICTQHDQSDAEFILMLAQEEKISIVFDPNTNNPYEITLVDINKHVKKLEEPLICSFNLSKSFASTAFVSGHYDSTNPTTDYTSETGKTVPDASLKDNQITSQLRHGIEVEMIRDRLEPLEGSISKDMKRYSKLNASQNYSSSESIKGKSISLLAMDSVFATLYEIKTNRKADVIITNTKLKANFPNATDEFIEGTDEYIFETEFTATSFGTTYIPPMTIKKPTIYGVQTAIVAEGAENTIDVDSKGQIRVKFHFDREKPTTCYVRLGTMYTGNNWGAQFLPRVNTEVIVSFINGNIDKPIIIGTVYNGSNQIPYSLPEHKTKSYIKTQTTPGGGGYNELLFEDKASEELLSLRAQKDYKLHALHDSQINIDNDQVEEVGNNETVTIGNDRTEDVKHDEKITIHNDRTEEVKNNETITIGNDRVEKVGNNENITIGTDQNIKIGSNASLDVGNNYSQKVKSNKSVKIGKNKTETITIAKALTIGAGYQVSVGGAKNETIGLSSTEQVGILKHIIAGRRYELQVGASSLILNADGTIILKGNKIEISGSQQVTINGKMIDLN